MQILLYTSILLFLISLGLPAFRMQGESGGVLGIFAFLFGWLNAMGGEWRSILGSIIWLLNPYFILVAWSCLIVQKTESTGTLKLAIFGPVGVFIARMMRSYPLGLTLGAGLALVAVRFIHVVANEAGHIRPITLMFGGYLWFASLAILGIAAYFKT